MPHQMTYNCPCLIQYSKFKLALKTVSWLLELYDKIIYYFQFVNSLLLAYLHKRIREIHLILNLKSFRMQG